MMNGPINDYQNAAMRNRRLLNRMYRRAQQKGDYKGAFEAAQTGDDMGLPIGRPAAIEEIRGAGTQDYYDDSAMAGTAPDTGSTLDSFDFRHSSQGGPGVGGYDFRQRRNQSPLNLGGGSIPTTGEGIDAEFDRRAGMNIDPGMIRESPSVAPSSLSPAPRAGTFTGQIDRRAAFSRAWQNAKTQQEKDMLVGRASELGVPMNDTAALPSLQRLGRSLLPAPKLDYVGSNLPESTDAPGPVYQPELAGAKTVANYDLRRRKRLM